MADRNAKWALNVSGPYYVDDQCIACDNCLSLAPQYFAMNDEDGHAYVKLQPSTELGIKECESALEYCPVMSIGNDG